MPETTLRILVQKAKHSSEAIDVTTSHPISVVEVIKESRA